MPPGSLSYALSFLLFLAPSHLNVPAGWVAPDSLSYVLQIIRCSKIASVKVAEIVALIQDALVEDAKQR